MESKPSLEDLSVLVDDDFYFYSGNEKVMTIEDTLDFEKAFIIIQYRTNERYKTLRNIGYESALSDVLAAYDANEYITQKQRDFEGNYPFDYITYQSEQGKIVFAVGRKSSSEPDSIVVKNIAIKSNALESLENKIAEANNKIASVDIRGSSISVDVYESTVSVNNLPDVAKEIILEIQQIAELSGMEYTVFVNLVNLSDVLVRKCRWPLGTGDKSQYTVFHYPNGQLHSNQYSISTGGEIKKEPAIGMTEAQVRNSTWGSPEKINRTTTANRVSEQWVYAGYRYIYFDDGIVTAIQDNR